MSLYVLELPLSPSQHEDVQVNTLGTPIRQAHSTSSPTIPSSWIPIYPISPFEIQVIFITQAITMLGQQQEKIYIATHGPTNASVLPLSSFRTSLDKVPIQSDL